MPRHKNLFEYRWRERMTLLQFYSSTKRVSFTKLRTLLTRDMEVAPKDMAQVCTHEHLSS